MPVISEADKSSSADSGSTVQTVANVSRSASAATDSTARSPEEVFGKQLLATTFADSQADKLHDAVTKVTDKYHHGKAFYSAHKELIDDAWHSMEAATNIGTIIDDWIGPINKVTECLLSLAKAQPFPFVELAVTLFDGVVKLEVNRRQNDSKARALILQLADMMGALLQLHFVEDPALVANNGQSVQGRVQLLMKDIEKDINNTGNLINKYHQHSLASKFFRSGQYATQFKSAGDALVSRKADIQFACVIHTTVSVDDIRKQVRETNTMILKLTEIVSLQSEKEEQWEQTIQQYGGRERVLENPDAIMKVAAVIEGRNSSKVSDTGIEVLENGEIAFSRKDLLELQEPLEAVLKESLPYYENKLLAQVDSIKNQMNKSLQNILNRLESKAHEKIVDPDIREVWMENNWGPSVKARTFVVGLHDYFSDRLAVASARANTRTSTTIITAPVTTPPASLESKPAKESYSGSDPDIVQILVAPVIPIDEVTTASNQPQVMSDALILAAKEHLQFLTMPYVSAIAEAFDDDASGFVKISEVNDFCARIPTGWTLLQWIAYWARGWIAEASIYSVAIWQLVDDAEEGLAGALTENCHGVYLYLRQPFWFGSIKQLTWCAASKSKTVTDTPVDGLVKLMMAEKEKRLEAALLGFGFKFDSIESVRLIMDSDGFEKDLFALLFVVIQRHIRMIDHASTKVLDERDFLDARYTMIYLVQAIKDRISELDANLKGLSNNINTSNFAGGVYEAICSGDIKGLPEPLLSDEKAEKFWTAVFDYDPTPLSNFTLSYDFSGYQTKPSPPVPERVSDVVEVQAPGFTDVYRSPLVVQNGLKFVQVVTEHENDSAFLCKETLKFTAHLRFQLMHRRLRHPVPDVLDLIEEVVGEIQSRRDLDELGTRLFTSVVGVTCAFAKLPDIEDKNAPRRFHYQFLQRLRGALEWVSNELAGAIRMYKQYCSVEGESFWAFASLNPLSLMNWTVAPPKPPLPNEMPATTRAETIGTADESDTIMNPSITNNQSTQPSPELMNITARTAYHPAYINGIIDAHTSFGAPRFRGAAVAVLTEVRNHRYRQSWASMKHRRDLRKIFVAIQAKKIIFDEVSQTRRSPVPGAKAIDEQSTVLLKEVSSVDRPLWHSMAHGEYRKTVWHMHCTCDLCGTLAIGTLYKCLNCSDYHLCDNCFLIPLEGKPKEAVKFHHAWHPLIKLPRPVVRIWEQDIAEFQTLYERLSNGQDISATALGAATNPWSNAPSASTYEPGEYSDVQGNESLQVISTESYENPAEENLAGPTQRHPLNYHYKCANCHEVKTGARYVSPPRFDSLQYCPDCEATLAVSEGSDPVPLPFRQLLRVVLPRPQVDGPAELSEAEKTEQTSAPKRKTVLDQQLSALELRFSKMELQYSGMEDRIQGLEKKLDRIIDVLMGVWGSLLVPSSSTASNTP
ncbi:hypothetical protein DL93DRAFT_2154581 [Clavulina sp. PMI_390]|nr:hypothetical protein DL93DRAFT_2154581 [Clavulina sp. PMI_390]